MTAIDTDTDLSVIEALDFEAEFPCIYNECGKPSQFIGWYDCCGESGYFCAPCMIKKRIGYLWAIARSRNPVCPDCCRPHALDGSTLKFRPIKAI